MTNPFKVLNTKLCDRINTQIWKKNSNFNRQIDILQNTADEMIIIQNIK